MNRVSICAIVFLFSTLAVAEGEQQFANLGTCKVESGETIQDCRIGYRTWGKLNEQRSNVVVLFTWFTGNTSMLVGEKHVDPAKYYVVAIDALADGVSSSPSNSTAQPRKQFPRITIADMVETEHRLLTEALNLKHVHAVMGGSMGAMQALQWSVQFPDFMDVVIAISGSTQLTPHDLLFARAEKQAILDSKEWNDGNYKAPLHIAAVEDIQHLELESPDKLNQEITRELFDAEAEKMEQSENFDPSDRLRQLEAVMALDVSKKFAGRMEDAARAVKARMLIIISTRDLMVNPAPALHFAELLHVEALKLDSNCGHLAAGCRGDLVVPAVQKALSMN